MLRNFSLSALVLILMACPVTARTIIAANTPGSNGMGATNTNIPATFGDNIALAAPGNAVFTTSAGPSGVVGTPNMDLNWTYTGASTGWQFHAWTGAAGKAGGGALQMDSGAVNSTYSVTFTPSGGTRLILNSFNFIGDTNNDTYQYRVDLVNVTTGATVFTTTTALWTTNTATSPFCAAPTITINHTAATADPFRLDIVRIGGTGAAGNIAIDNLDFDQTAAATPPVVVVQPAGPTSGRAGTSYDFSFTATDSQNAQVKIQADWGDGEVSAWTALGASGVAQSLGHTYPSAATFPIRARAANAAGSTSEWVAIQSIAVSPAPGSGGTVPFVARPAALTTEWRFVSRDASGVISKAFGPGDLTEIGMAGHQGAFSIKAGAATAETPGAIDGVAMPVMYFDGAAKSGEGWKFIPNTGVTDHYEYTLIYDMFVPASNTSAKLALFQGNAGNTNDADYFLLPSAPGGIYRSTASPNSGLWTKGAWQRVAVVVDYSRNSDKVYVNGVLKSTQPTGDWMYGTNAGWILSDNGSAAYAGDHSPGYISAFAVVPRLMTDPEVAALGGVTPGGIFEVSDGFPNGLVASPNTNAGTITLTWSAADNRSGAAGVEVLRGADVIAQLPLAAATFTDTPQAPTATPVNLSYTVRPYGGTYDGLHSHPQTTVTWGLPNITTDLAGYFPFEGNFRNLSGDTRVPDAVPYGPPRFIADGRRGQALAFLDTASPGQRATFDASALDVFSNTTSFTVSLWFRHMGAFANRTGYDGGSTDPVLIGNKNWTNSTNTGWAIVGQSDGSVKWNYKGTGGSAANVTLTNKDKADAAWHHLLVIHDRTTGTATFHVDGALLTSASIAGQGSVETGFPVCIGGDVNNSYRYRGDLDEVAFWARALTTEEAALVYQNALRNTSVTGSNLADKDLDGLDDGWETGYFGNLGQTADGDPDGDGISNMLEFGQGGNPAVSQAQTKSRIITLPDPANPGHEVAGFAYTRPTAQTDLQYVPEISTSLGSNTWQSGDAVLPRHGLPAALPDGMQEITVYRPGDIATLPRAFFRLRVSRVYQGALALDTTPQLDYTASGPVVRWITATPTATILEYGNGGDLTSRYENHTPTTQHEVYLTSVPPGGDLAFAVVLIENGVESRSINYWASGSYDLRPPRVPDQGGFLTGGTHAADAAALLATLSNGGKGWCLDVGCGDGRLAFEIARQSEMMVVAVDTNNANIEAARAFLAERGVLGSRVTVLPVANYDLTSIPFRPHTFNLITNAGSFSGSGIGSLAAYQPLLKPTHGRLVTGPASAPAVSTKPRPASFGSWTHEYGNPSNTTYGGEELANATYPSGITTTAQTQIQWIGKPGGSFTLDRGIRQGSPLSANGRFYTLGEQRVIAMDSHNGYVLWSKLIPGLARFNVIRDSNNIAADDDALFAATGPECWRIEGDSGTHQVLKVTAPSRTDITWNWGMIVREGTHLLGTAVSREASYRKWWGPQYWYDSTSGTDTYIVCSDNLFSRDPVAGSQNWLYEGGLILNPTVTVANGRIIFLESRNATAIAGTARMLPMAGLAASNGIWMVALDLATGAKLWEFQRTLTGGTPCIYGTQADGKYLVTTSNNSDSKYYLYAYDAATGGFVWSASHAWLRGDHAGHQQHPVVMNGLVYQEPKVYTLATGALTAATMPGRNSCSTYVGLKNGLIHRGAQTQHYGLTSTHYGGNISIWNPSTNTRTLWNRMRPSCWISTIGGDGCVLVQDGAAGCSCGPWYETTVALSPN